MPLLFDGTRVFLLLQKFILPDSSHDARHVLSETIIPQHSQMVSVFNHLRAHRLPLELRKVGAQLKTGPVHGAVTFPIDHLRLLIGPAPPSPIELHGGRGGSR